MGMQQVSEAVKVPMKYPTHRMSWVQYIAQNVSRVAHFDARDQKKALDIWDALYSYVNQNAPRGSGIDNGTFLGETSSKKKLVFVTAFHHMDEHGGYDGWTEHRVVVTPEFQGFSLRVTGCDRNGIKDYLGELFHSWLSSEADHPALVEYLTD